MTPDAKQYPVHMRKLLGSSNLWVRQLREDYFLRIYEEVKAIFDGEMVRPELATHLPHFELRGNLLYCLAQGTLEVEQYTQHLVSHTFRQEILELAYEVLMAGYLGREKTWPICCPASFGQVFTK